jgi:hypothetical protein
VTQEVHGLLDYAMAKLRVKLDQQNGYSIHKGSCPTYMKNLQAEIRYKDKVIGVT